MLKEMIEINKLFAQAQEIYNTLTPEEQEKHVEEYSELYRIPYCIRWGENTSDEVIASIEQELMDYPHFPISYEKNKMYYDSSADKFIVEQYEYDDSNGFPLYSAVEGFPLFKDATNCISNIAKWKCDHKLS